MLTRGEHHAVFVIASVGLDLATVLTSDALLTTHTDLSHCRTGRMKVDELVSAV